MRFNKPLLITIIASFTLLLGTAIASAQDAPPANPGDGNPNAPAIGQRGFPGERFQQRGGLFNGEGRELVEQYTGMDIADVAEALRDGETLASLIEANGEDVNAFIDEAVVLAEARIDQALDNERIDEERAAQLKDNLRTGIERRVNGEYPLMERRGERGRPGARILRDSEVVALVEEYTGMEPREVLRTLRGGDATLASLIEANGGNVDAFIDEAVALLETRIEERRGEEVDEQIETLIRERITAFVYGEVPLRRAR